MPEPLGFYDHHRQRYAGKVPIPEAGEFMIGDYTGEGTVGRDGEFKITLVELHGDRRWRLYPHLEVFGDGVRALRRAIDAGLLDLLGPVNSRAEFARRLLAIELVDRSDHPLPGGGSPEIASAESTRGGEPGGAGSLERDPLRASSPSPGTHGAVRPHA
jgi:hypothetical protein